MKIFSREITLRDFLRVLQRKKLNEEDSWNILFYIFWNFRILYA